MGQYKVQFCFKTFFSDLDDGPECTLSRFADDTKLGVVADAPESHAAIKSDFQRLEECGGMVWQEPDGVPGTESRRN